jgi:DNA-binding CsgD family transcriptional regulator
MHSAAGLLGRASELEALRGALDRALAGQPSFVLLLGEPGIGKTRLLEAVAADAASRGLRPLVGSAIESGTMLPFLPLVGALGAATGLDARSDVDHRDANRPPRAGSDVEAPDAASAARLVEAIHDEIVRVPTVLLIDDIQWADASTLTVLDYLAHRARHVRLAVVVASRDEPPVLDRLAIADGRRFEPIHLRRLGRLEVAGQIEQLTGAVPSAARVDRIHRRTDGNPFFVEQLVAAGLGSDDTEEIPSTLRLLVARRVARLPASTHPILAAIAVIGRPADRDEISAVAATSRAVFDTAVVDAIAEGVVRSDSDGVDLRHPIYREVIIDGLEPAMKASLHRRAAARMEASGRPVTEVAEHWWQSDDPAQAWTSALAAGDATERSSAFAEARLHLQRALQRWPEAAPGRADVILRAARAAWICGDPAGALGLVRRLPADSRGSLDALVAEGSYAWDAGDRVAAIAVFERLSDLTTEATPPSLRGRALWGLGRARVPEGRYAEAADLAVVAASFAAEADNLVGESEAWALNAMSRAFAGTFDGLPALERALDLAVASGAPSPIGHAFQFLVDLTGLHGDIDQALELAQRGIDACDRLGLGGGHGSDLRGRAAMSWIESGDWAAADAILEPADPRAFPSLARGYLAMRRGALDAAAREFENAAVGGSIGGPGALGGWLELARAELAWVSGDRREARRIIETVPPVVGVWGLDIRARAAWWQSRVASEPDLVHARSVEAASNPNPLLAAALVAGITAESGTAATAPEAWQASANAWTRAQRPFECAFARLREAEARFTRGDRVEARAALRDAAETAAALEAAPLQRAVDDLARRARVAAVPARRSSPDPSNLTQRELDVLVLLAEGLTNPQIAERLFLSRKTVGIHVSRILEKLDAHTRGEAVAAGRRRGVIG